MNTTLAPGEDAVYPGLDSKTLGITTYLNNTLHGCHMGDLMLIFTSQQQPNSAKLQIQTGPIYCTIDTDIPINITVEQSFSGTEFLFEQRASFSLRTSEVADITADDFFTATILSPGQSASLVSPSTNNTDEPFPLAQGEPSNLVRLLDAFVKSYYSVVMWDLDFDSSNNAFASEDATNYLVDTMMKATSNGSMVPNSILGTPELVGNPAQFEMQYICSVPKKKDTGSLVISVFVADMVILSVFWNIFNWFALRYLQSRDPDWNVCAGCRLNSDSSRAKARVGDMDQDSLCGDEEAAHGIRFGIQRDKEQDEKFWKKPKVSTRSDSFKSSQDTLRAVSRSSVHVYAGKPKMMDREGTHQGVVGV
ncbi:hypothetical protein Daus18300_006712 [Diaporthe australafricana]|uniref:Uncharacterized protein n=1 Tax=Diaporthe australafricana TaxID=127596 RepID=A0ABR3WS30_9PEZI